MFSNQESGLFDLVVGSRWSVAAWRAGAVFIVGYVIPALLFRHNAHAGGMVYAIQFLATLLAFVFTAAALFVFAQARDAANAESTNTDITNNHTVMVESTQWSPELLQQIEWKHLSDLCTALYQEKGFRVVTMSLGTDYSINMRLFQGDSKRPAAIAQCQAWGDLSVDAEAVQGLLAEMTSGEIPKGFYMTAASFTNDARALAMANHITPIDGKLLLAMVNRLPVETRQKLLQRITAGDYMTPTCPACGLKMVTTDNEHGPLWGCRAFPRCKQTLTMRAEAI